MQSNREKNTKIVSLEMTRLVQDNMKQKLDELIKRQLENIGELSPQTWKIVGHNIVKAIKESSGMVSLFQDVESTISSSIENFIFNIDNEPTSEFSGHGTVLDGSLKGCHISDRDTGLSHYDQLIQDTSQHKPLELRKQVLSTFFQNVSSDIVSNHHWPHIRRNLRENLCEENIEIFSLCLKIHVKLMQSNSHLCVREGFINLIEGLHLYYSNVHHNSLPTINSGVDLSNTTHHHLLQIFHLILEATKEMPKNWLRYGEKRVEEIVGVFVNLLAMHSYSSKLNLPRGILYPFHILAILDPKATWCRHWLHTTYGRNIFLNTLTQNLSLISYLVEEVLSYVELHENNYIQGLHQNKVTGVALKSAIFSHSLNILSAVISHEKGRCFFPITLIGLENPVSLDLVLTKMVTYLNFQSKYETSQFDSRIITDFIKNYLKAESEELSDKFISLLIEPLFLGSIQNLAFINIPYHTYVILLEFTKTTRISYLLGNKQRMKMTYSRLNRNQNTVNTSARRHRNMSVDRQYSARTIKVPSRSIGDQPSPAKIIETVTTTLLRCKSMTDSTALLFMLVICSRIFALHEGLSMLESANSQLLMLAINLFKQLFSESETIMDYTSYRHRTNEYGLESHSLYRSLVTFLTSVASTPCGIHALSQQGVILPDLLLTLLQVSHNSWDDPEFRYMVSLMTSMPETGTVLSEESSRIMSRALNNLHSIYEDPIALMTGTDRKQIEASQQFINMIFTFVPNLKAVIALLNESEGSSEATLVDADCSPTTLSDLLSLDDTTEPWHYISLLTLRALTTNIDVCLHLHSTFRFQEKLLKLQSENVASDDEAKEATHSLNKLIIIDEHSLLRNQILTATYAVGGPTERSIPPTTVTNDQLNEGEPGLFCTLPPPQFMSAKNLARNVRSTRMKGQSDFQKFLQDTRQGLHDANWLTHARRAYKSSRTEDIKAHVLLDVIEQVSKMSSNAVPLIRPGLSDLQNRELQPEELVGIQLVIRYGVSHHLLQDNAQNEENLMQLLHFSHSVLKHKNADTFQGFDWFIATVFLLCGGNTERCRSSLENISSLPVALFLWRALAEDQESSSYQAALFGHILELLIKIELPLAFSALQLAGASWWLICKQWMAQCFWNILDWPQICHWLAVAVLNQPDYMLYFCVCLLRHMQPQILQAASDGNVWEQIMITPVEGFHVGDQLSFMEKLAKRHRTAVLHHLIITANNSRA